MKDKVSIHNIRLETGFEYENDQPVHTQTESVVLNIKEGEIDSVSPQPKYSNTIDADGLLALPAFKDMHTHLDKHYFGLPWEAHRPENKTVKDMIAYEQKIIPELLETATPRAEKLIEQYQSFGTDFARSHVNIDATSGLQSLEKLQAALENKGNTFDTELVAFPQHGLFYTPSAGLMEEAAALNVIDYIGGLDPTSIDGSIEKVIDFTVQLALDHQKGIDIHLHETDEAGLQTIEYLIEKVNENPVLKGKTFISHCYILGVLEPSVLEDIAQKLAEAQIGIITTVPFTNVTMPIPLLEKHGVDVRTGTDNIVDHWSTFGSANILNTANRAAQLYGMATEFELSRALKYATNNKRLPLDDQGQQQWPKAGDKADFVLIDTSCSAEAVSRISTVKGLIHDGKVIFKDNV